MPSSPGASGAVFEWGGQLFNVRASGSGRGRRWLALVVRNIKDGAVGQSDRVGSMNLRVGKASRAELKGAHQFA